MELNPLKYAFKVSSGKILGFMVTQRGIEANLKQFQLLELSTPSSSSFVDLIIGETIGPLSSNHHFTGSRCAVDA